MGSSDQLTDLDWLELGRLSSSLHGFGASRAAGTLSGDLDFLGGVDDRGWLGRHDRFEQSVDGGWMRLSA